MAYSFLQVVNKTLQKARELGGDSNLLTTFDDSARQTRINIARQAWLTVIQELFDLRDEPFPQESKTSTITLVEGTSSNDWGREYDLPADFTLLRFPLINETNGYTICEYPGGYDKMREDQLQPRQFKGRPEYACISPMTGALRMDTDPQSEDAGIVYQLYYDRYIKPYNEFDLLPFADNIADALVPATVEIYNRDMKQSFDQARYAMEFARAARQLSRVQGSNTW
jgi:hypothetical protein